MPPRGRGEGEGEGRGYFTAGQMAHNIVNFILYVCSLKEVIPPLHLMICTCLIDPIMDSSACLSVEQCLLDLIVCM